MATHDVTLPLAQRPTFAPRCIVCDRPHPEGTAHLRILGATAPPSWGEDLLDLAVGTTPRAGGVQVITLRPPACTRCARRADRHALAIVAAKYVGALGGVAIMIGVLTVGLTYVGFAALALGIVLPVVWELSDPPALGATVTSQGISYEFRSSTCAEEFARLNPVPTDQE